ncbi:MAG: integrase family protein [Actinomycetia bacterium]|nr:integrase family protein [Actinomycetes bacterium]
MKVYLGRDLRTGKKKYKSKTFRGTKREAQIALAEFVTDTLGRNRITTAGTVGHLLDKYVQALDDAGRKASTMAGYQSIARSVASDTLSKVPLADLGPEHLDDYYARLRRRGCDDQTVLNHHRLLFGSLRQGVKWRMLRWNPGEQVVKINVVRTPIDPPTTDTALDLVDEGARSRNPDLAIAEYLLIATGGRRGEICALRRTDLKGNRLKVSRSLVQVAGKPPTEEPTKSHQQRTVLLDPDTLELIHAHIAECERRAAFFDAVLRPNAFILCDQRTDAGADGSIPWRPNRLTQAHARLRLRVGSEARLHDLRHHTASVLADAGEGIPAIAARLGNHPETAARRYAHLVGGAQERAAEIMGDRLRRARPR